MMMMVMVVMMMMMRRRRRRRTVMMTMARVISISCITNIGIIAATGMDHRLHHVFDVCLYVALISVALAWTFRALPIVSIVVPQKALDPAHRPLSSSFLGLHYRILNISHKKELLRGLRVNRPSRVT